jgi:methylenetetrahydrofolate reductase (NADPH)
MMPHPGRPKRMVYGPCGGVRPSGGCEVDGALPCPWAGEAAAPPPAWAGPVPPPVGVAAPGVVTDLHVTLLDAADEAEHRFGEHLAAGTLVPLLVVADRR